MKFKMGVGPSASSRTTKIPVRGCAEVHSFMALVSWTGVAAVAVPAENATVTAARDVRQQLARWDFTTAATIAGRREIPMMNMV